MIEIEKIELYSTKKLLFLEDASAVIEKLKSENKTVGLCHGGFDLTHPGHFLHFEKAKNICDILFVSITSEKFITGRKGSKRPIYPDQLRAYMIACNENVDYVLVSPFKTGVEIIKHLKPDFYIKGPDYINKKTPGITAEREAVATVNGMIKYTDEPPMSTSGIIDYIKQNIKDASVLFLIDRDGTLIENEHFLGRDNDWKKQIEFKTDVLDLILYVQKKYRSTNVVVSNQAGVARNYFDTETVEDINLYISSEILKRGINIENWQYCPDVDKKHALENSDINWNSSYVKEKTDRKPSTKMVFKALKVLNKNVDQFKKIIVLGDSKDDSLLAEALKALYLDAGAGYEKNLKMAEQYLS